MRRAAAMVPWVILVLVAAFLWRESGALATARGQAEEAKMRADGLAVEVQSTKAMLVAQLGTILTKAPALAPEIARIKASVPAAEVIEANERSTKLGPAGGTVAPAPTGPADVLVYRNDKLKISVFDVTLRAPHGTDAVAGYARVMRIDSDGSRTEIYGDVFTADLTNALELKRPTAPGWGFGAVGLCSFDGCSAGPVTSFPPIRVPWIGGQIEISGGVSIAGSGKSSAIAIFEYRR